ncbi:MAG: hypothetical protein R3C41_14750 [Calditrichia bacterium]
MKPYLPIALTALLLLTAACSKSSTNPPDPQLTLSADTGVIEAWLTITAEDAGGTELRLTRDGVERMRFTAVAETTVVDTGLLPNHSYTYRTELLRNGKTAASQTHTLTTMDTTSHDFQWEVFEFPSPYGSGVLRDVAIIDEDDIWAVGEIYSDSAQPWLPYNALHWDGQQWALMRIKTNACGGVDYPPIETVFAFSANDVLFAHIDGSITRFDGVTFVNDCNLITQLNGSARKMWGRSSNDLYVVSSNGFIAHYDGANWQRIESGTALPINDVWGSENETTSEWEILCIASNQFTNQGKQLLRINNEGVTQLPDSGLSWALNTVWHISGRKYFIGGDGLYHSRTVSSVWRRDESFPPYYKTAVRGSDLNDIVVVGFRLMWYWNGLRWHNLRQAYMPEVFSGVDIRKNMLIALGGTVVVIGRR